MSAIVSARRIREMIGQLPPGPAYATLADALRLLIGEGRIPVEARLPSERALTEAMGLSRTTITRAYATLCDKGYARAFHGSGTFATVPLGHERAHDRVLVAGRTGNAWIDLDCAADSAPPDVQPAYLAALNELPAYLGGHGYFPTGLPALQEAVAAAYKARGLHTTPEQIIVTPGTLAGASIVIRALAVRGQYALIEAPTYPNIPAVLKASGMRIQETPLGRDGWNIEGMIEAFDQVRPTLAYLIPDFQNPTGALMTNAQRKRLGKRISGSDVTVIIDETHQGLALDRNTMPAPFASFAENVVTLGSLSKTFWGGLRVGWIRSPLRLVNTFVNGRMTLDLGVPVFEQLVAAHLLRQGPASKTHLERLREQRDQLMRLLSQHLPDWRYNQPSGGSVLWCELPDRGATALAAALIHSHVAISPGPVFSTSGGLDTFVRLPWTRSVSELEVAVERISTVWRLLQQRKSSLQKPRDAGRLSFT